MSFTMSRNDTTRWSVEIYTNGEFDISVDLTADDITELIYRAEQLQEQEDLAEQRGDL